VTTADPDPPAEKRGRHARSDDEEAGAPPPEDEQPEDDAPAEEPAPAAGATRATPSDEKDDAKPRRTFHPIGRHPAGVPLIIAAGLITGLSLVPLLFDELNWSIGADAAANTRSAASPWPASAEPWFTPGWVAGTAFVVGAAVLVLALMALRLPDLVVLVLAAVLTVAMAWAAFATLDVVNAGLWELVPVCLLVITAFALAATATARWRSTPDVKGGEGAGGVAAAALATWLAVGVVLLGGAAIASSARTHAFGDADAPAQGLPGLLTVRATDAGRLDGYEGYWMAQLAAAQVTNDRQASAYAVRHSDSSAQFPTLLVRGDDTGGSDVDDTWWLTLVRQSFDSQADVEAWCSRAGLAPEGCSPRMIGG
jgi:hypothetical protein